MGRRIAIAFGIVLLLVVVVGELVSRFLLNVDETPVVESSGIMAADDETTELKRISVVSVEGTVERRKGKGSWVAVETGDSLQQEEAIRTDEKGRAVLDVGEIATVEITPRSQFSVQEVSRTVARVRLDEGRISAVVHGKGGSKLKVAAKGSDAVAEADGGEFSVLTSGDGQVAVATRKGDVRLSAKSKSVWVTAGTQSVVQPDLPPAAPEPIPASLFLKVVKPKARLQRNKGTTIEGTTTPGAFISINGVRVQSDHAGQFSTTVALREGKNPVVVEAEDAAGNRKQVELPEITVKSRIGEVRSKAGRWGGKDE